MTAPSSTAADKSGSKKGFPSLYIVLAGVVCLLFIFGISTIWRIDPYIDSALKLEGSTEKGSQLFRMNCAGCHGVNAQGLIGPNLHDVSTRLSKTKIINQVTKGRTPPMPRFELEPQEMADLLKHLNSLN